jgi:hypothetical protein
VSVPVRLERLDDVVDVLSREGGAMVSKGA